MLGEILNDKYELKEAISESHAYEVFSALEIETGIESILSTIFIIWLFGLLPHAP